MSANVKNTTKKVASAALAGMMALGTVPAAAIAEEASSSVETQSVSESQDFASSNTKITKATIGGKEADNLTAAANGSEQAFVPTEITTAAGQVITLTANADGNYTGSDGYTYVLSQDSKAANVGTYTVKVTGTKDGQPNKENTFTWTLTASALSGVTASQTTFTYNGAAQNVTYYLNGSALDTSKVTITYIKDGDSLGNSSSTQLKDAGGYTAYIQGNAGTEYEGVTAQIHLTINKLDLSNATVRIADTTSTSQPTANDILINGDTLSDSDVEATFKSGTNASGTALSSYNDNGSYTYTVSANSSNVTGSKDVTFSKVGSVIADANWNNSGTVNLDGTNPSYFDASKVTVSQGGTTLPTSSYTFTYEKENSDGSWSTVSANDVRNAGTYRVYVTVNAKDNGYAYGGVTNAFEFTVSHGTNAVATVTYDGKAVGDGTTAGNITATYDGSDVASKATVSAKAGNTTLTKGTDYQVVYYKVDANGNRGDEVSSITDAGSYQMVIRLLNGYHFAGGATEDVTNVTVQPESVVAQVSYKGQLQYGSGYFFNHTGSAITPTVEFFKADSNGDYALEITTDKDGNETGRRIVAATSSTPSTWKRYSKVENVPASAYTVTYTKDGKSASTVTDNGTYSVAITDAKSDDNYAASQVFSSETVTVDDQRTFDDVANDAWYAQSIYDAKSLGLMNGYGGTNFFGPEASLTRGQAACVLYNMAGGDNKTVDSSSAFSDVTNEDAYYYKAVTWAASVGLIHGYGDGTFRPDQNVTREEFAAMLANYANMVGGYANGDESKLASYPDGSSVSDWAKSSVAWAVANMVMGNGSTLNPTGNITRAETAAMLVNLHNAK